MLDETQNEFVVEVTRIVTRDMFYVRPVMPGGRKLRYVVVKETIGFANCFNRIEVGTLLMVRVDLKDPRIIAEVFMKMPNIH